VKDGSSVNLFATGKCVEISELPANTDPDQVWSSDPKSENFHEYYDDPDLPVKGVESFLVAYTENNPLVLERAIVTLFEENRIQGKKKKTCV